LFFFACAKKNQKSTPENENSPFSGEEAGLSFSTAVASAKEFNCTPYVSTVPDNFKPNSQILCIKSI